MKNNTLCCTDKAESEIYVTESWVKSLSFTLTLSYLQTMESEKCEGFEDMENMNIWNLQGLQKLPQHLQTTWQIT